MLTDRVVLEVDEIDGADGTGVFEMRTDLDTTRSVERSYVVAERGQYVKSAIDILPDSVTDPIADFDFNRREGYHLDGGAGSHTFSITTTRGIEEETSWGDGSASDGESTKYDAAPNDIAAIEDVLEHWLSETRSDSEGQTRLYIGHHSDGTYADEAGAFGEPVTVTVVDHTTSRDDRRGHSEIEVSLTMRRTATIPNLDDALDGVSDAIDEALDGASDLLPDW